MKRCFQARFTILIIQTNLAHAPTASFPSDDDDDDDDDDMCVCVCVCVCVCEREREREKERQRENWLKRLLKMFLGNI